MFYVVQDKLLSKKVQVSNTNVELVGIFRKIAVSVENRERRYI